MILAQLNESALATSGSVVAGVYLIKSAMEMWTMQQEREDRKRMREAMVAHVELLRELRDNQKTVCRLPHQ